MCWLSYKILIEGISLLAQIIGFVVGIFGVCIEEFGNFLWGLLAGRKIYIITFKGYLISMKMP